MYNLKVNDKIKWSSAAGVLEGIVTNIELALNGNRELIPWIDVKTEDGCVRMCASDSYLKMMRAENV